MRDMTQHSNQYALIPFQVRQELAAAEEAVSQKERDRVALTRQLARAEGQVRAIVACMIFIS